MESVKVANFWARLSCPRWNKIRGLRHFARKMYRNLAKKCWESVYWQEKTRQYQDGYFNIDTYPGPYCHPYFANWEEDDSPGGYNLISDQSGCVIKYATSYCAWKIFEETGAWPQKTSKERLDAKRWVQFLAEAGYKTVDDVLLSGARYVGVNPNEGEWGLVVWLEEDTRNGKTATAPTYLEKKHQIITVNLDDFTWVRIANPKPKKRR